MCICKSFFFFWTFPTFQIFIFLHTFFLRVRTNLALIFQHVHEPASVSRQWLTHFHALNGWNGVRLSVHAGFICIRDVQSKSLSMGTRSSPAPRFCVLKLRFLWSCVDDKQVNMILLISMRACRSSLSWLRSGGETCSPLLPQVLWYFSFQTQPHRCVFAPCVSESVLSVRFSIAVMLFLAFS